MYVDSRKKFKNCYYPVLPMFATTDEGSLEETSEVVGVEKPSKLEASKGGEVPIEQGKSDVIVKGRTYADVVKQQPPNKDKK